MPDAKRTPEEIWAGDLFERKDEAEQLIAYIESVVARPVLREDKRAYTIAVDARYGEGKTFFLRRLAEHMGINHPVAFVDAWADDLADEPLTALAATLKLALEPYVDAPEVQDRLKTFMAKSSRVARIASYGLLKRGLGLALTAGAVDAAEEVISGASKDVQGALNDGLREAVVGQVDEMDRAVRGVTSHKLMEERVAAFEAGKEAVQEMKASLEAIVASLAGHNAHPPIIIVIDELDRCRPTYAVKLLEEIKHLFDVPGLVFIMALHSDQLAHSVNGAYGSGFDGRAYLRRFIDREYRLATPKLEILLERLCSTAGITDRSLSWPRMAITDIGEFSPSLAALIAEYLRVYGLGPRDAFQLIDLLQTATAIAPSRALYLPYLLPLAVGTIKGLPPGALPEPVNVTQWVYVPNYSRFSSDVSEVGFAEIAHRVYEATTLTYSQLVDLINQQQTRDPILSVVANGRVANAEEQPSWTVYGYPRLLQTVARFSNPQLAQ